MHLILRHGLAPLAKSEMRVVEGCPGMVSFNNTNSAMFSLQKARDIREQDRNCVLGLRCLEKPWHGMSFSGR